MSFKSENFVDEMVTHPRRARLWSENEGEAEWPKKRATKLNETDQAFETGPSVNLNAPAYAERKIGSTSVKSWPELRRAHAVSFVGLLLFTAVTYFRPYELIPALAGFNTMAFWLAVATLAVFIPTQFAAEGTVTVRPREVNLALLLLLAGLLSTPRALEPATAWASFVDFAKVVTMFIVMVNVVRTEMRWRAMIWLSLLVSLVLSVSAVNEYLMGHFDARGERIAGFLGRGLFENPNDLALYLVTMIPLALGLLFVARSYSKKLFYGLCALLMVAGTVVTLSRGGFLGLACASFVFAWKIGRRNRLATVILFLLVIVIFFIFVPPELTGRLLSSVGSNAESSAVARQNLLWRSIFVTLTHPVLGVGMGNFHIFSIHEQVTHNAYTQVSSEMGIPGSLTFVLFILFALKLLRGIESETYEARSQVRVFYLSVALQASLVGYMVSSFFASVAYLWNIYFLIGYALCLHRLYEAKGRRLFGRASVRKPFDILAESNESDDSLAAPLTENLARYER